MRPARRIRWFALLAPVLLVACREVAGPEPMFEPLVALYAVLQPDSSVVRLLADQLGGGGERAPLSGGAGIVQTPGGAVTLVEFADSLRGCFVTVDGTTGPATPGCYVGRLPQAPVPGDSVTFQFALPGGGTVVGAALVPGAPVATIPAEFHRVTTDFQGESAENPYPLARVPIDLGSAPFASSVRATASVARAYYGGATFDIRNCGTRSSMTPFEAAPYQGRREFVLNDAICTRDGRPLGPWDSLDVSVHVSAVDANYSAYIRGVVENSALTVSRAGFGVDGAVGVFGAVATTTVSFRVVYEGSPF